MAVNTRRRPQSNVDANLDAAAAPISIEPEAGGTEARHAARMAELVAKGVPRQQAMVIAAREVAKAEADEADARADARLASGYRDPRQTAYNAATFADGYGYDENNQPAWLGRVDINKPSEGDLRAQGERRYNARDPRGAEAMAAGGEIGSDYAPSTPAPQYADMTVPGPRTLDGKSPTPSRGLAEDEAEAYNARKPNGLSQRDRDMRARGFVPVVTPEGVRYQLAYQPVPAENDGYKIPGEPGRAGFRPELAGKYEEATTVGPDGNPVQVLRPTEKFRDEQKATLAARSQRLAAERKAARDRWQATAYLAGGSQNLNSGNRWVANALVGMKPEQQAQAMRYMLPGGDRAAAVDAQNMQNAGDVIKRFMTSGAAAGAFGTPATEAAMKQRQRDEAKSWFDKWYDNRQPGLDGDYTSSQHDSAVNFLMQQYGITRPEAEAIAQSRGVPRAEGGGAAGAFPDTADPGGVGTPM